MFINTLWNMRPRNVSACVWLAAAVLVVSLPQPLWAKPRSGMPSRTEETAQAPRVSDGVLPAPLQSQFRHTAPYGSGRFDWFVLHVYDAYLWTDAPKWSYNAPFALQLKYFVNLDPEDITGETLKQLREVSDYSDDELATFEPMFNTIYPKVRKQDRLTAYYYPTKGLRFFHNNTERGSITDLKLARAYMDIWLSPKTTAPDLRKKLLPSRPATTPAAK